MRKSNMIIFLRTDEAKTVKRDKDFHQQKMSSKSSMTRKGGSNRCGSGAALTCAIRLSIQTEQLLQGPPPPKRGVKTAATRSDLVSEWKWCSLLVREHLWMVEIRRIIQSSTKENYIKLLIGSRGIWKKRGFGTARQWQNFKQNAKQEGSILTTWVTPLVLMMEKLEY